MAKVYPTEEQARTRAEELTREWEESGGERGFRAYAAYSASCDGWVVLSRRRDLPGTCV